MDKNDIFINDNRGFKKTIVYTHLGKQVEEELTYDKFVSLLNDSWEFFFNYKDMTIDFAYHYENDQKVWELNINGYESYAEHQYFNSVIAMINDARVCGKTIADIWDDLYN